jgi:16S rRNA (cytosine967-C5)-methyltransferase
VVADGLQPPFPAGSFHRVLVDAPCSGLGSLRRRPDARWRIDASAPERLATLQSTLLSEATALVVPGGRLVYSVCTLTRAETIGVAEAFSDAHPGWVPVAPDAGIWEPWGSGGLLLPGADTDGMAVFSWIAPKREAA